MAKSPFSLEGKTAIVTGGGTGIGKSIAIEFARAGADVALCSRKLEHLEPVVKAVRDVGKRSFAMAVDVRQEDQVKAVVDRAVQEWGRLDIMVNNAGASFRAKPEEIAYPCIFLASDASAWMTGETIVIDGGPSPREMEG